LLLPWQVVEETFAEMGYLFAFCLQLVLVLIRFVFWLSAMFPKVGATKGYRFLFF
jgi:hypothetical protein